MLLWELLGDLQPTDSNGGPGHRFSPEPSCSSRDLHRWHCLSPARPAARGTFFSISLVTSLVTGYHRLKAAARPPLQCLVPPGAVGQVLWPTGLRVIPVHPHGASGGALQPLALALIFLIFISSSCFNHCMARAHVIPFFNPSSVASPGAALPIPDTLLLDHFIFIITIQSAWPLPPPWGRNHLLDGHR